MNWDSKGRKIRKKVEIDNVEYDDSKIIDIDIIESIIDGNTLTLGTTVASQLILRIKSNDIFRNNAKVVAFICLENDDGSLTAWEKLATTYVDGRSENSEVVTLSCYDKMYRGQRQYNSYSNILKDNKNYFVNFTTIKDIALDIARILEVTLDPNIALDDSLVIERVPFYTNTVREILGYVAGTLGSNAHITRDELLTFVDFGDLAIKKRYTKSDYSTCNQTNEYRKVSYVKVSTSQSSSGETAIVERDENGNIVFPFGESIDLVSEFLRYPETVEEENIHNVIKLKIRDNYSYTPISLKTKGNPNLKVGDRIEVELKDGKVIDSIILSSSLKVGIGLSQSIEAPSDTADDSEFGRFSIYDEINKAIDEIKEEVGLNDKDEDATFTFSFSGNAVEGVDFRYEVSGDASPNSVGWGTVVTIFAINEIYIGNEYVGEGAFRNFTVKGDRDFSISVKRQDIEIPEFPEIFISTTDPTASDGKNGDVWIVIGGE